MVFGDDSPAPSFAQVKPRYRYRLMNLLVPTENDRIYDNTNSTALNYDWFNNYTSTSAFPVAENVIAVAVIPEVPSDPNYTETISYNSLANWTDKPQPPLANQLPPNLKIVMVAIDENSARRIENGSSAPDAISGPLQRFQSALQSDPSTDNLSKALDKLGSDLADKKITYRIFTSKVPMRESKWTK